MRLPCSPSILDELEIKIYNRFTTSRKYVLEAVRQDMETWRQASCSETKNWILQTTHPLCPARMHLYTKVRVYTEQAARFAK